MGTASFESKLICQLTEIREEVLYKVFLCIKKAYDTLDHEQCMDILVGCCMGMQSEWILCNYWEKLFLVDWAGRYYGASFNGYQGGI